MGISTESIQFQAKLCCSRCVRTAIRRVPQVRKMVCYEQIILFLAFYFPLTIRPIIVHW